MKTYTYDFQGKLINLGDKKAQTSHQVHNMRYKINYLGHNFLKNLNQNNSIKVKNRLK